MAKKRAKVTEAGLFQKTDPTPAGEPVGSTPPAAAPIAEGEKVKNTYYFSADTDHRLEQARVTLRQLTGSKLSKSDIIEAALRLALDDLDTHGAGSALASQLTNQ